MGNNNLCLTAGFGGFALMTKIFEVLNSIEVLENIEKNKRIVHKLYLERKSEKLLSCL